MGAFLLFIASLRIMTIVTEHLVNRQLSVEEAAKVLHALAVCPKDGSELVVMQKTDPTGKVIETKISCLEGHVFQLDTILLSLIAQDRSNPQ